MSVSRHKVRNDRNILFTSKLCCEALVSTLLLYAVPTLLKEGTLCYINQNTVLWGPLPYITDKMGVMIKDTAQKLRNTADSMLFNLFREKRTLVLVQIQFESFVLEQSDVLSVLKSKLTRHISTGVCMTRSVKSTEFLKLLKLNEELVYDKNKNIEPKKYLAEKRNNSNRNGTFWMILESQTDSSRITCEAPRKYVRVDVFRCMSDNKNEIEIPSPKNVLQHIITAYPFHSYKHDLPEMPHEDEKYPVQATEIDAGQLSFGSYRPTIANSIFPNNSQRSDHQRDIQEARRNFNAVTSGTGLQRRTKPARYPDYTALDNRVSSFQTPNWDSNNKPDTLVLVNWGFFYTGTEDLVRCYQCGLGLKDWVKDDDVLQEHVKHSATCDYLLTRLGRETVDQIKISLESPGCSTNTSSAGQLSYKMRSPRYQTMASRLASFKDFPRHIHISHQQLAVAGLFYTGKGDLCRCFTCDGGLKDWSAGDDPIKEHATYFPKCTYINQLKGSEYVRVLQRTRQNEQSTKMPGGTDSALQGAASGYVSNLRGERGGNQSNFQGATGEEKPGLKETEIELPMQKLAIRSNSSFTMSDVFQKLGYAEIDVITARTELESKGNMNPTAEEIINTILDIQEKTQNTDRNVSTQHSEEDLQAIQEENERLSKMVHCMLCVTNEADILFLPCTHHRVCKNCAKNVIFCPVCDHFIKEKVKTYRA